jgi:hypothetical protein
MSSLESGTCAPEGRQQSRPASPLAQEDSAMVKATREQMTDKLRSSQEQLSALLEPVADIQDWQPAPEEWSFRYIAAHLATVDRDCFLDRVVRISAGEHPHFGAYFNTGWDFSRHDLKASLRKWVATRQEIFHLVRAVPEEGWSLTGTHPRFGTITVLSVLHGMLDHDLEHLEHLERLIAACRAKI